MEKPHPQTKVVASLLYRLGKNFKLNWVHDGEELTKLSSMKVSAAKIEALAAITSVDVSTLNVKNKETGKNTTLSLILGNEDSELVADWTVGDAVLEQIITEFSEYWEK